MTVYEAIRQMRLLTARKRPFALSYMSFSLTRRESHGEVEVEHALLTKNPRPADTQGQPGVFTAADFMLTYRDQDTGESHHLWQPLLLSLNHEPLTTID